MTDIESRLAITDLVHRYAFAIRHDRPEEAAALFAEDGWFEIRDGQPGKPEFTVRHRLEGRQGVHDFLVPGKGKPHPVPMIHNLLIDVTADTARASSVMEALVVETGYRVLGEYADTFVRENGTWRFASRIYLIFTAASSV